MGSEFLRIKGILEKIPATEDETRIISEVSRIKTILVKSGDESVVHESLTKLQCMAVSMKILEATGIGKSVSDLQNHASKDIKKISRMLIKAWRLTVDEWVIATDKMQSLHQQQEEEGGESNKIPTTKQQQPKVAPMTTTLKKKVQISSKEEDCPKGVPEKKVGTITHGVSEVIRIQGILSKGGDESIVSDLLKKLQLMGLSVKTLEVTGIGRTVGALRKHPSKAVCGTARKLVKEWKGMVNDYLIAKESSVLTRVSEEAEATNLNTEKSKNPKSDEESREIVISQHRLETTKRKLQETKLQPQKRLKSQVMVLPEKKTFPHEIKKDDDLTAVRPNTLDKRSIEKKLEATKRKLQQGYNEAQKMKKLRRTQVLEVQDVLRLGLAHKHQDNRFGKRSSRPAVVLV